MSHADTSCVDCVDPCQSGKETHVMWLNVTDPSGNKVAAIGADPSWSVRQTMEAIERMLQGDTVAQLFYGDAILQPSDTLRKIGIEDDATLLATFQSALPGSELSGVFEASELDYQNGVTCTHHWKVDIDDGGVIYDYHGVSDGSKPDVHRRLVGTLDEQLEPGSYLLELKRDPDSGFPDAVHSASITGETGTRLLRLSGHMIPLTETPSSRAFPGAKSLDDFAHLNLL